MIPASLAAVTDKSSRLFAETLPWLLLLAGVVIAGGVIIFLARRYVRASGDETAGGFTLHDLREMHRRGAIGDEEFARAKAQMIGRLKDDGAAKAAGEPCESFQEMMAERRTDVPRLARELDIARSVLADLVNGGVLAPIGKRLVNAFTRALSITVEAFDAALQRSLNSPRLGHAKADGPPTITPRPYEEVIRSSNMALDRKEYWLSED